VPFTEYRDDRYRHPRTGAGVAPPLVRASDCRQPRYGDLPARCADSHGRRSHVTVDNVTDNSELTRLTRALLDDELTYEAMLLDPTHGDDAREAVATFVFYKSIRLLSDMVTYLRDKKGLSVELQDLLTFDKIRGKELAGELTDTNPGIRQGALNRATQELLSVPDSYRDMEMDPVGGYQQLPHGLGAPDPSGVKTLDHKLIVDASIRLGIIIASVAVGAPFGPLLVGEPLLPDMVKSIVSGTVTAVAAQAGTTIVDSRERERLRNLAREQQDLVERLQTEIDNFNEYVAALKKNQKRWAEIEREVREFNDWRNSFLTAPLGTEKGQNQPAEPTTPPEPEDPFRLLRTLIEELKNTPTARALPPLDPTNERYLIDEIKTPPPSGPDEGPTILRDSYNVT